MSSASYIALSGQTALTRHMDVIANNIANSSTPGFKGSKMLFTQFLVRQNDPPPGDARQIAYVQDIGTDRDRTQGSITLTNNPLDFALQGDGYFTVETPNGPRYTRSGRFQLDAQGQIVNGQGYPLLSDGGRPMVVPQEASEVSLDLDGNLTTDQGDVGKIAAVKFEKDNVVRPASGGLFVTDAEPQPAVGTKINQGMLEESNVLPVVEVNRMLQVSRHFAFTKEMLDAEADRLRTAIDKLGKSV